MPVGWPVTLQAGPVGLRPIRRRDAAQWRAVRGRNAAWLAPWDATPPPGGPGASRPVTFAGMVRHLRRDAAAGRTLPFVVTYEGRLVGQLTVFGIEWGSLQGAGVGYWIDQAYAGRGVIPTALAMAIDHCFTTLGLHRIEVNIRPENTPSRRVVEKLGLRCEGRRERYLHIAGAWRDHLTFAVTSEEVPDGLLARWQKTRSGAAVGDGGPEGDVVGGGAGGGAASGRPAADGPEGGGPVDTAGRGH